MAKQRSEGGRERKKGGKKRESALVAVRS